MVVKVPMRLVHEPPSQETISVLQSTPWSAKLLADPNLQPINIGNRLVKSNNEDSITSETLQTPKAILAWQTFYKPPSPTSPSSYGEFLYLLALGTGLNGHADTLHGGTSALLMDEAMSQAGRHHMSPGTVTFTATMTVNYRRRVPTPGIVLCRAWLEEKSAGRKLWVRGTLEDGEGVVLVEASALCVEKPDPPVSKL